MDEKTKLALMLFANTQITLDLLDELEGTLLYSRKEKNLLKRVQEKNEFRINKLYAELNKDTQKIIQQTTNAVETTIRAAAELDLGLYIQLMDDLRRGKIKIIEDEELQ